VRKLNPKLRVFCFDIDGTLCTNTEGAYDKAQPYPTRIARVNALHATGHKIILYTARGTTTGIDWSQCTRRQLKGWEVKYDALYFGKPSADAYIDDKSLRVADWLSARPDILLGIMQGRLSPPNEGKKQSFPRHGWREEFRRASALNLQLIEWIFEAKFWSTNPLLSDGGLAEIKRLSGETGVNILSVCANYFMDLPLLRVSKQKRTQRLHMLKTLIGRCRQAGIRYLIIPFVDSSRITSEKELTLIAKAVKEYAPFARSQHVNLCLETNLDPARFAKLLNQIHHPNVQVNYDIGNSTSLGFDVAKEFETYGEWIATIHIKDRVRGGKTVPLGTGDADFKTMFSRLPALGYSGPLILEAARIGNEMKTTKKYVQFVTKLLRRYLPQKGAVAWN
jgi:hexulose-6-phosphate isomerase